MLSHSNAVLFHLRVCRMSYLTGVQAMEASKRRTSLVENADLALLMRQLVALDSAVPLSNGGLASVLPYRLGQRSEALLNFFR